MSAGFSRRAFLASGASLAGAGLVGVQVPRAAASTLATSRDLALRRSTFLPLLGEVFRIVHEQGSLAVVLRQVSDLQPNVSPGAEDQFSLIFSSGMLGPVLSQGTYPVSHPGRGRISLFVVPVGGLGTAQQYQAIIDSRPLPRFRKDQR